MSEDERGRVRRSGEEWGRVGEAWPVACALQCACCRGRRAPLLTCPRVLRGSTRASHAPPTCTRTPLPPLPLRTLSPPLTHDAQAASTVKHLMLPAHWTQRTSLVTDLVACYGCGGRTIVFTETKNDANELAASLSEVMGAR